MTSLSVFDRLSEPGAGSELAIFREGLRRDLEALLNTRRRLMTPPSELDALEGTLIDYGLDDFTNESRLSEDFRNEFVENVERLIRRFEPRIGRFSVTIREQPDQLERTLRFRVAGVVDFAGTPQEVHFDSHVDAVRGHLVVRP